MKKILCAAAFFCLILGASADPPEMDFTPKVLKVTVNGETIFDAETKTEAKEITLDSLSPCVFEYTFVTLGAASKTPARVFQHFHAIGGGGMSLNADFSPDPATTQWIQDQPLTMTQSPDLTKLKGKTVRINLGFFSSNPYSVYKLANGGQSGLSIGKLKIN